MNDTAYKLGGWLVEPALNRIRRGVTVRNLRPQVMDTLKFMIQHRGEVISIERFLADLWRGKVVTRSSVYNCLNELRTALGDDPANPRYLENVLKRGYRLIAPVSQIKTNHAGFSPRDGLINRSPSWHIAASVLLIMMILSVLAVLWQRDPGATDREVAATSIAVMPFRDLSPGGEQGFFSDGLTDEVIKLLGTYPGIKVAGRRSSFALGREDANPRSIGVDLGVAYVLEGSVRREQERVRVTANLVSTATGYRIWSQQFDRTTSEIFNIQDEIAKSISEKLVVMLVTEGGDTPVISQVSTSVSAYDLYLMAVSRVNNPSLESLQEALALLDSALNQDGGYVKAHALMAETYLRLSEYHGHYRHYPRQHAVIDARLHVQMALAGTDDQADALAVQGLLFLKEEKPEEAESVLRRALEINPSHSNALLWLSHAISSQLRPWTDEIEVLERLVDIDAAWPEPGLRLAVRLGNMPGQQERSWSLLDRYRKYSPDSERIAATQYALLWQQGRLSEILKLWEGGQESDTSRWGQPYYPVLSWYALAEYERATSIDTYIRPHRDLLVTPRGTAREGLQKIVDFYLDGSSPRGEAQLTYECIHIELADLARTLFSQLAPTREQFVHRYRSLFATQFSPALTMAWLERNAGNEADALDYAEMERRALQIRSNGGTVINAEYHRTSAMLEAFLGNEHEALAHLLWLATEGPLDPILLLHPVFDELGTMPGFSEMQAMRERRINAERDKLGLPLQQHSADSEIILTST